jgi:hypothetical protein
MKVFGSGKTLHGHTGKMDDGDSTYLPELRRLTAEVLTILTTAFGITEPRSNTQGRTKMLLSFMQVKYYPHDWRECIDLRMTTPLACLGTPFCTPASFFVSLSRTSPTSSELLEMSVPNKNDPLSQAFTTYPSTTSSEIVFISTRPDNKTGKRVVLWNDILRYFGHARAVKNGKDSVLFLPGADLKE